MSYYNKIDDNKIERIFEANLSLDSSLLPKSHAVGGNADFVYIYDYHHLMIEVTLSEKTNQRRANDGKMRIAKDVLKEFLQEA
ncbi:AlwI family type II restriction endonuclease [Helicobacter himalayensis]|uniref:AlwI family type II restriction endonuclease n=1 Tax=Helicobacter himalayensis TaxID=1591088 RepID=UPI0008329CD8|nr:AlwI family type II restriction endonuclease [Helicobacter himalayensis]